MAEPAAGLRERKKQQTRDAIVREALRLFDERGYDATTIADIAAAAEISPRTFFGYFPSKEAVVFHDADEVIGAFGERLAARPAGETTFDALRAWILGWLESGELQTEEHQCRRRLIRDTPALQAHDRSVIARFEALLTRGAAVDLGVAPDALRAHLVGAAAAAVLDALGEFDREDSDIEHGLALMDEAVAFLQGGLEALRGKPSPGGSASLAGLRPGGETRAAS